MTGPIPEILEQPLIPPPLHGVNPRSIMGRSAWDKMRKTIYAKHGYRCAACGTTSRSALIKPYLEAHERFEIDYSKQTMTLIGMEPLCHACHSFVHSGLLELRLHYRKISKTDVASILGNGVGVLEQTGGVIPIAANKLCRKLGLSHNLQIAEMPPPSRWSGWKMVWEGEIYPSPFPTETDWRRQMRKSSFS